MSLHWSTAAATAPVISRYRSAMKKKKKKKKSVYFTDVNSLYRVPGQFVGRHVFFCAQTSGELEGKLGGRVHRFVVFTPPIRRHLTGKTDRRRLAVEQRQTQRVQLGPTVCQPQNYTRGIDGHPQQFDVDLCSLFRAKSRHCPQKAKTRNQKRKIAARRRLHRDGRLLPGRLAQIKRLSRTAIAQSQLSAERARQTTDTDRNSRGGGTVVCVVVPLLT